MAPREWPGSKNGVLFVGERGDVFTGFPDVTMLFPAGEFAETKIPQNEGGNHYTEWTSAIFGNGRTSCPFSYSGPLTEAVLLRNVAFRSGKTLQWDAKQLAVTNDPAADRFLKRTYRAGWKVAGLS